MNEHLDTLDAGQLAKRADLQKPLALTMLAPATLCNQSCPRCYLTEVRREPVREFTLKPEHFAQAIADLDDGGAQIGSVCFQGYEVTLPGSWSYVEAAFKEAKRRGIRRSFVTNGMRVHSHIDSILSYDPSRIGISLDGADEEANDRNRGLAGAFKKTLRSLDVFLERAPHFHDRIVIVSVLYGKDNAKSLLGMPRLLAERGLTRWGVGLEITSDEQGNLRHANDADGLSIALAAFEREASHHGISFFVGDEFGLIDDELSNLPFVKRLPDAVEFLRLLPSGHIYVGKESMKHVASPSDPLWRPSKESLFAYLSHPVTLSDNVGPG